MRSGNRQPLGISALFGGLLTAGPVFPLDEVVRTLTSRIPWFHLYLSKQIGVRSSKTSQCVSANRPSVVPQGSPRIWCLSKSLLVSQIAMSVCRHDLPPCTTRWVTHCWASTRMAGGQPLVSLLSPLTGTLHTGSSIDLCMHIKSRKNQLPYSWLLTYWE